MSTKRIFRVIFWILCGLGFFFMMLYLAATDKADRTTLPVGAGCVVDKSCSGWDDLEANK